MRIQYGKIDQEVEWKLPTPELFYYWLKDFLNLPCVNKFKVYLTGRFIDKLHGTEIYTGDVDIVIIGNRVLEEIENVIYEGTKLSIEKYGFFADIQWADSPSPLFSYNELEKGETREILIYMHSNKWIEIDDEETRVHEFDSLQVRENLWFMKTTVPTDKQLSFMERGYVYKNPIHFFLEDGLIKFVSR